RRPVGRRHALRNAAREVACAVSVVLQILLHPSGLAHVHGAVPGADAALHLRRGSRPLAARLRRTPPRSRLARLTAESGTHADGALHAGVLRLSARAGAAGTLAGPARRSRLSGSDSVTPARAQDTDSGAG